MKDDAEPVPLRARSPDASGTNPIVEPTGGAGLDDPWQVFGVPDAAFGGASRVPAPARGPR